MEENNYGVIVFSLEHIDIECTLHISTQSIC